MGPLIVVLIGAIAVFWYLGLLTPARLRVIGAIGLAVLGLFVLLRGQPLVGVPLLALGGWLAISRILTPKAGMTEREAANLLGVRPGASEKDIRKAYRLAMASAHPDKGGSDAAGARLNEARDVLMAARLHSRKDRDDT